jgi:hypothetical protein
VYGQNVEGFETVRAYGFEERPRLLWGEGLILLLRLRSLDDISDVARDQAVRHGVLQNLGQRGLDMLHGPRTEASLELLRYFEPSEEDR